MANETDGPRERGQAMGTLLEIMLKRILGKEEPQYNNLLGGSQASIQTGPNWVNDTRGYGGSLRPWPDAPQTLSPEMQILDLIRKQGLPTYGK